jgi:hypothetical protein
MVHSEYPREPEEAFVQTGRPVFGKEYLDRHRALCDVPIPVKNWPDAFRGWDAEELRLFDLPKLGHRYIAGADVAEGLEHGDYSSLSVFDADLPRPTEVLTLHGHWPPDRFAELIAGVARLYPGLYCIERNNHGLATILHCRRLGVKGLYAERPVLNKAGVEIEPGKLGWLTSSVTKPLMIDGLEEALRLFQIELRDATAIPELTFYQTQKDGSTGAPAGQWDDRVIRLAIAVQMRKYLPARVDSEEDREPAGTLAARNW